VADRLWQALQGLPDWLVVAILSAAPISEVRGGIPVGVCVYKMPVLSVYVLAVIAAIVSVLWVPPLYYWMAATFDRTPVLGSIFRWLTEKAEKKKKTVEKFGFWAVVLFVAVPCPGFGGWTGSVLAAVCRLPYSRFLLALTLGTVAAATIVMSLTLGGVHVFDSIQVAQ